MNRIHVSIFTALVLTCAWADAGAQGLSMRLADGRVSVFAQDVTLGEVLARWAEVGGATIVNAEDVPAVRLTMELADVPERAALATLLRPLPGYIVVSRTGAAHGSSTIDRLVILPARAATPGVSATRAEPRTTPQAIPAAGLPQDEPPAGVAAVTGADGPERESAAAAGVGAFLPRRAVATGAGGPGTAAGFDEAPATVAIPDGEPLRAPTRLGTLVNDPNAPPPPAGDISIPDNPFGATSGTNRPGLPPVQEP